MARTEAAEKLFSDLNDIQARMEELADIEERIENDLLRLALGQRLEEDETSTGRYVSMFRPHLSWECGDENNSIGTCIYDRWDDPAMDSCLFCGEPYERK